MANEQQKDEIVALESIFNTEEFSYHITDDENYYCTIKIFIPLPNNYYFTYKDMRNCNMKNEIIPISHLPPLSLFVKLPNDYPSLSPPEFTLCCSWLRYYLIYKLCKKLDELWVNNSNQEILFTWMAFLQNETLEYLNIHDNLNIEYAYTCYKMRLDKLNDDDEHGDSGNSSKNVNKIEQSTANNLYCGINTNIIKNNMKYISRKSRKNPKDKFKNTRDKRVVIDRQFNQDPVQLLIDYNEKRINIEFKKNFYTCNICFADKSGESCTQFKPCDHVFCKQCISGYFNIKIKDGAVKNINCPEEKCESEATNEQIKDLVSPELFSQYDSILLNATLATMLDIVHCPRRQCQYPVTKEPNEQMAKCPSCSYVFCLHCKMVYHGIEPCKISTAGKQDLVNRYQNATESDKIQLEKRYGKKQLKIFVENTMSENWIQSNSHNCPHCSAAIEKSDGCNKMTCSRCNTFFCWTCGVRLNRENPYLHYQLPESKCYERLYDGMIDDDDDDDDEDFVFPVGAYADYSSDDDSYDENFIIDFVL